MTLDELMKVYNKAASDVAFLQYEGPDHRAGIRAIVEALRDEVAAIEGWSGAKGRIDEVFKKILASDGVDEKAELPELQTKTVPLTGIRRTVRPDVVFEPDEAAAAHIEALEGEMAAQRDRATVAQRHLAAAEARAKTLQVRLDSIDAEVFKYISESERVKKAEARAERLEGELGRLKVQHEDAAFMYSLLSEKFREAAVREGRLREALKDFVNEYDRGRSSMQDAVLVARKALEDKQ